MRVRLDLDDELLAKVRQLAKQQATTLGQVISDLVMESLATKAGRLRNGVAVFPPKAGVQKPDLRLVNQLRDEA
jgi:hypothetical protein